MQPRVKKLINNPEDVVDEALAGLAAANHDVVRVDVERRLVLRRGGARPGKVAVISGGGSGHEPMHGGYVGIGMLDAACVGRIFTSPVPEQILAGTLAADGGCGALYIVKNYTGDLMNFGLAAEEAREHGVAVELVFVDDDVAIEEVGRSPGRRGTAATFLVEKIAGASAESGAPLATVAAVARRVVAQSRSYGVGLSSGATPDMGRSAFELGDDEIELGVGIHGEPGRRRRRIAPAAAIVAEMTRVILNDLQPRSDAQLLAFVNSFGATPLLEQYIVYHELACVLKEQGLLITRSLVGNYVTSLDMAGVSITLLMLDDELTRLWDAPAQTAGFRQGM